MTLEGQKKGRKGKSEENLESSFFQGFGEFKFSQVFYAFFVNVCAHIYYT